MRCLVSGGAGFIGSHLCERLIREGHKVIAVDDCSTGRFLNLRAISNHQNFHFIAGDINKLSLNSMENIDWVFHLAAKADIVPSIEDPEHYHDVNVNGTIRMLQKAREYKVKRFIYAASSSCYGIPDDFPTDERAQVRCEYPYALSKWMGEQAALHWAKVYKVPVMSLRLFNVYGPRARTSGAYGAVFGVFLAQLVNNKPLTVVGDGEQSRDFTHVDDVVSAFILAAESSHVGQVLNIGSGETVKINRLIGLLGECEHISIPKRPGEPGITYADIRKARELLSYSPSTTIAEGVRRLRENIEDYRDAPLWTEEKIKEATKTWFTYLGEK